MKEKLTIVKVGGKIVEEADTLSQLLADFSTIPGYKLLVHGGGRSATKIAAHAADIAKNVPHARDIDNKMSDARRRVDWDEMFSLALDPDKPREYLKSAPPSTDGTCTMCGKMCAMRTVNTMMDGLTIDLGMDEH